MPQVSGRVSVIIPGRCEDYFQQTIDSVLDRATGDVEVVAVIDGYDPDPPLVARDDRVKLIKLDESIGQRAAYNLGVRESSGEYVMKIDAHALLSPGFDEVLKAHCPPETTVLPEMRRLDVHKWDYKHRGKTRFMFFGLDLYCHYWRDYRKRPEAAAEYPEVMTGQGSCWFTARDWNDHIGLLDERVGSWGNVGIEVSLRTWLCGGTQIVNPQAWQAHWFRKDEGGFPYPFSGRNVAKAHNYTRKHYYFKDDAFEHQTRPFRWLIEKFNPPGWEAYLQDGFEAPRVIVYYTDSQLDPLLARAVRKQINRATAGVIPIISVSQKPLKFGRNICVGTEGGRSYRRQYEQVLAGLKEAPEGSIIYLCEHDVFYHPSHFAIVPKDEDHATFNLNRYYYRLGCKNFAKARGKRALSQCVAFRELLIAHCEERLAQWEAGEDTRMKIRYYTTESNRPNVDIRHGDNLTSDGDWKRAYYRGKLPKSETVENLPGWGHPPHFQRKTGYRAPAPKDEAAPTQHKAAKYLHALFRRWFPQVSPVRIPRMRRTKLAQIFGKLRFRRGAEIGVQGGKFSEVLLRGVPGLHLLCVDLWGAYYKVTEATGLDYYEEAQKRLAPYDAELIRERSVVASLDVPDESLDFVYIDADHRFDYVMEDIIAWGRKVKPGGIIAGHDYYRTRNFGVQDAVDLYMRMHSIHEWFITDEKEASWFGVKP